MQGGMSRTRGVPPFSFPRKLQESRFQIFLLFPAIGNPTTDSELKSGTLFPALQEPLPRGCEDGVSGLNGQRVDLPVPTRWKREGKEDGFASG